MPHSAAGLSQSAWPWYLPLHWRIFPVPPGCPGLFRAVSFADRGAVLSASFGCIELSIRTRRLQLFEHSAIVSRSDFPVRVLGKSVRNFWPSRRKLPDEFSGCPDVTREFDWESSWSSQPPSIWAGILSDTLKSIRMGSASKNWKPVQMPQYCWAPRSCS